MRRKSFNEYLFGTKFVGDFRMKLFKIIICLVLFGGITAGMTIYLKRDQTGKRDHTSNASESLFPSGKNTQPGLYPNSGNLVNIQMTGLLQNELAKRTGSNTDRYANVVVDVESKFSYDYGIEKNNDGICLKAKDQNTAKWLINQYIRYLSINDSNIDSANLPPMIIDLENEPYGNFDFIYREPHFSPNLEHRFQPICGSNSVEEYWDLWGHNLLDELKEYGLGKNIYMNGNTNQICFSKQILLDNVTEYLNKRAASSNHRLYSRRFLIMPLDNMAACECSKCKELGNTDRYATPAVINFLDRLADRFPDYTFYTAAYHSTAKPPTVQPEHPVSGVMISASELYSTEFNQQKKEIDFLQTVRKWGEYSDTLFVWDYAANFNDYLTPLPVLYALKKNLKFFRDCGIIGIFLQGSSYDYSPFDDVKTHVATALMINGRLDVDILCRHYFAHFYPVSAPILADYYLSLEKTMEQRQIPYDLHGNLGNAIDSYFIVDDFLEFYQNLKCFIADEKLSENEKKRLERLYTALSFTWLQIAFYQQTDSYNIENTHGKTITITPETESVIEQLSQHNRHRINIYREKNGYLVNYLKYWEKYSKK